MGYAIVCLNYTFLQRLGGARVSSITVAQENDGATPVAARLIISDGSSVMHIKTSKISEQNHLRAGIGWECGYIHAQNTRCGHGMATVSC